MKRFLYTLSFLFVFTTTSLACEICGCGVGNFYMGSLPSFTSKFIGIRYHYMHYHTRLTSDPGQFSNDFYKTAEIWSGFNIGKNWQVLAFMPYRFNKKISDDGTVKTNGLGDITLLVNYSLVHTRSTGNHTTTVEQQLWIGGGIKLPTGAYRIDLSDPHTNIGDANSQVGTGSTDFLINTIHHIGIKKYGLNTSVNYKINTSNPAGYRFGNRLTINSFGYYRIRMAGIAISPNLGLLYELAAGNDYRGAPVDQTGGYLLNASGGAEVNINKITVGVNTQLPLRQYFAEGQTLSGNRGVLHISFAL